MERARDTGEATASGDTHPLPGEGTNDGTYQMVIYVPVYHWSMPTKTVDQRREALQGFVFANVDTHKLFDGILGQATNSSIDCEVFDGAEMTESNLLHSADNKAHVSRKTSLPARPNLHDSDAEPHLDTFFQYAAAI